MLTAQEALASIRSDHNICYRTAQEEACKTLREWETQPADFRSSIRTLKLTRGDSKYKEIALTFDDGPHTGYTKQLLSILDKYNVPATFFVVGVQAEKYPDLVKAEEAKGHLIANHTYHHVSLPKIPREYVTAEMLACTHVISHITGQSPRYFRPPGGEYNQVVADAAEALGYTMVLWTDDPGDYSSPGDDVILQRTLAHANPGGIILLHDGIAQTVRILPRLLQTLKQEGYTFVRVDQMHRPKLDSPQPELTARLTFITATR